MIKIKDKNDNLPLHVMYYTSFTLVFFVLQKPHKQFKQLSYLLLHLDTSAKLRH